MGKRKVIGLGIITVGFLVSYAVSYAKENLSFTDYYGSRYFFLVGMPLIIAGIAMIIFEKEQLSVGIFGKLLLFFIMVIWLTMSLLLIFE